MFYFSLDYTYYNCVRGSVVCFLVDFVSCVSHIIEKKMHKMYTNQNYRKIVLYLKKFKKYSGKNKFKFGGTPILQ